jgi:anti-anti-sigma factor
VIPQPSKLQIDERQAGDVAVLTLSGQILLDDGDLAFRKKIHDLFGRGIVKVVVDLSGVTSIDSSGIGMMVAKVKSARERRGDIKLARLNARTQSLLASLKLAMVFEILDDQDAAVRAFSWDGRKPVR